MTVGAAVAVVAEVREASGAMVLGVCVDEFALVVLLDTGNKAKKRYN